MKIYAKLAKARQEFHNLNLKKSGVNKFAGYKYFELSDFVIPGMAVLADNGLVPVISFGTELAEMTIHDVDEDSCITITSPMAEANLKGCHPIQNMGAVQTYQRRYLWMAAMEIVEHDAIDSAAPVEEVKLASRAQHKTIDGLIADDKLAKRTASWIETNRDRMTSKQATDIINHVTKETK